MKIKHGYFKDAEEITLKTKFLQIMGDDDRVIFEVTLVDGHTIEVSAGDMTKDKGVLYSDRLVIQPKVANAILITKPEYKQ